MGGEVLQEGQQGSEGFSGGLGGLVGFRSPSWSAGLGQEAVPEGRKDSGGSAGVGRPYRMEGRDQKSLRKVGKGPEAIPEGRDGSGGYSEGPGGVGQHSRRARIGQEALPKGRKG